MWILSFTIEEGSLKLNHESIKTDDDLQRTVNAVFEEKLENEFEHNLTPSYCKEMFYLYTFLI